MRSSSRHYNYPDMLLDIEPSGVDKSPERIITGGESRVERPREDFFHDFTKNKGGSLKKELTDVDCLGTKCL